MIPIEEFHPALVHFPIVLLLTAFALDAVQIVRSPDLAERTCLANAALAALMLGVLAGAVAAVFGDVALDKAVARGFAQAPLEAHEDLALTTLAVFGTLAAVRAFAWWRRVPLSGGRAGLLLLAGAVGAALLLATAYRGGDLVYRLGVNVRTARAL